MIAALSSYSTASGYTAYTHAAKSSYAAEQETIQAASTDLSTHRCDDFAPGDERGGGDGFHCSESEARRPAGAAYGPFETYGPAHPAEDTSRSYLAYVGYPTNPLTVAPESAAFLAAQAYAYAASYVPAPTTGYATFG